MSTTRHGYHGFGWGGEGIDFAQANIVNPPKNDTGPWKPTVTNEEDPIAFGTEVFAHHRMPDGTPLTIEERRYIAGAIINHLREGEQ